jgi:hypothetical protein
VFTFESFVFVKGNLTFSTYYLHLIKKYNTNFEGKSPQKNAIIEI